MLDAALEIRQYVQISEECREEVPEIPWSVIIGMRNRLIHAYFSINLDVVWITSKDDISSLIKELKKLLD